MVYEKRNGAGFSEGEVGGGGSHVTFADGGR